MLLDGQGALSLTLLPPQQFWKSYYNTLDLAVTVLCGITILVIFFKGCSAKGEEVFDTFLLVVRNLFQFGRLALVMRK